MSDEAQTATDELRGRVSPSSYRSPPKRAGVVARDELVGRLLEVPEDQLVVVAGPAGFGKTMTVALWDDADPRPFAWVHLDDLDNDPVHLLQHVALALDGGAQVDPRLTRVLTGVGSSPDLDMVPALLNALEDRDPVVLVLDDVHRVTSADSLRCLMGVLVGRARTSQLVLVGRDLSRLPLARHALTLGVLDLAAGDLAMGGREAALLFEEAGVALSDDEIEDLVRQTEGWPAGLHMAALRLAGDPKLGEDRAFSGRDRLLGDYLFQEVLAVQPAEMVDFLQRSAVLDSMDAALLDELLERGDSAELLARVEQSGNLFLVPVDRDDGLYRYHHLFGEMLRSRFRRTEPDQARALDLRASRLLEDRGDVDGAIRHATSAGDVGRASDLVFARTRELMAQGRVARLGRRLELLGMDAMDRHVAAALAWAWYGQATGDADLLKRALSVAERSPEVGPLADGSPSVRVATAVLSGLQGRQGVTGIVRETQIAREGGRPPENPWWVEATMLQGAAYWMLGELDLARQRFHEALAVLSEAPALEAPTLAHLALLALEDGDGPEADRLAGDALTPMTEHDLEFVLTTIVVFPAVALIAAQRGRREEAERAVLAGRRMVARLRYLSPYAALMANLLLARAALALGKVGQAVTFARDASRARRRDSSATHLNEQLDDLLAHLDGSAMVGVGDGQTITTAQLRVLNYLPTHLSLQEIAEELSISRNTAKSHAVACYRKLGVSSRSEAVGEAQRLGVLAS